MWLVVWNVNFMSPYIGHDNPKAQMFFRAVETTNQIYMYVCMYIYIYIHTYVSIYIYICVNITLSI